MFFNFQWPSCHTVYYIVYRVLVALALCAWIVVDIWVQVMGDYHSGGAWFVFATNWGFILIGCTATLHAAICIHYHVKPEKLKDGNQFYLENKIYKVLWL